MRISTTILLWASLSCVAPNVLAEKPAPFIFKPTKGDGPFPVAVWLHGYRGYSTNGYVPGATAEALQKQADVIGAVIVGFPGTIDLGDGTQKWSEDPAADHSYIQQRLQEFARTVPLDTKRVALFGFSQGAMVAGDLASRYPDSYMGAILMSPGGLGPPHPARVRLQAHSKQVYFCLCGAEEQEGNVALTKFYARHVETVLGAKVNLVLYPGVSKHARPPDFMDKFPGWTKAILRPDS